MNRDQLDELPPVLDVPTAQVLHVGRLIKIPTEPLVRLLGAGATPPDGGDGS
jgi:hypothetical protein